MKSKTTSMFGAAAIATLALCSSATAASINGEIIFIGGANLDNSSLGSASQVNSWDGPLGLDNPIVLAVTGDLDTFTNPGAQATFASPWVFGSGQAALWSVDGFTFDLSDSTIVSQSDVFLNVTGTGILTGHGFDPTPGTFAFTISDTGGPNIDQRFGFVANTASVPDGGTTIALLGVSLLGLHSIRRKLAGA